MGDNLLTEPDHMAWWTGMDAEVGKEEILHGAVCDVLDKLFRVPERPASAPMWMPISGICRTRGSVMSWRAAWGRVW